MRSIIYILLTTFINWGAHAAPLKEPLPDLKKIGVMYCQNDQISLHQYIDGLPSDNASFVRAKLVDVYSEQGLDTIKSRMLNIGQDVGSLGEVERLQAVSAMWRMNILDFSRMKQLLDFKSRDSIVESYRKYIQGQQMIFEGKSFEGYTLITEAFNNLPYADESILVSIFSTPIEEVNGEKIVAPYFEYIKLLEDSNPYKYLLSGYKKILSSNFSNTDILLGYFKKAYELCPLNQEAALAYLNILMRAGQWKDAQAVISQSVKEKYYSPYFDLYSFYIEKEIGNSATQDQALKRAMKNISYFRKSEQDALILEQRDGSVVIYYSLAAALLLIGAIVAVVFRRNKSR